MAKYLKTEWFGVFLLDEKGILDKKLFPKNAEEIAKRLSSVRKGEILDEEKSFEENNPLIEEKRLGKIYTLCKEVPRINLECEAYGYDKKLLKEASILLARHEMKTDQSKRERRISQAIYSIDDFLKTSNILNERLCEWYGYFSEGDIDRKNLADVIINEWKMEGDDLDREEEESLKKMAEVIVKIHEANATTEQYVKNVIKHIAPNLSRLVGEAIAARLIASAGGLDRLAAMPSGTIQVLGAEKALFRHIKEGTAPPKHGIIFQHEFINKAPKKYRGKIARVMASKIAIASRADIFTKRDISDELKEDLEKRIKEIRG
ncbi:MAG: hypothetical protein U9O96_02020 [Candidatus Thermoplasmatota archaeon]|nr:hypothetical protein [Candidatus Thermoplasmatota archaeon]